MTDGPSPLLCPDCDEVLAFAFESTGGVGSHKRGDHFNTTPDTEHFICFPCGRAWKRRLSGPLTPDVIGELAFFTCSDHSCGTALSVSRTPLSGGPIGIELVCAHRHRHTVTTLGSGLTLTLDGAEGRAQDATAGPDGRT